MNYTVLPQDEIRLRKLLELNSNARERFTQHWINREFREMDKWRKVMDESMDEINHLVRKRTEDDQVRDMLIKLRERLGSEYADSIKRIEVKVIMDVANYSNFQN